LVSFDAENYDKLQSYCARALSGEQLQISGVYTTKDKSERWLEFLYNPVKDQKDNIMGICLTAWDITERKAAEANLIASEQRFRAVVQDQTDFIVRFQTNGQIKFVNHAFCRLFEQSEDLLLERQISSFFAEQFIDEIHIA
jgi:PAS domain-containing protein